ncbi:MAG: bifunctional folylpolyglutamate synthase/dihydrofolate synthase, partial [Bacteroidaceae bacterium]|nr:bifunctional folylpolyglutamate synthase/dihydrofolate synthase [Bacteroidaceae bacterium]
LDAHFGHPHGKFDTIHVGGTNGKGSTSHTLAAILQAAGFKVGLYTSPHLVDFRERIRVDGEPISQERVMEFVEQERSFFEPLHPSFFELTTALAFKYFAEQGVDVAVIEVGLGGRLDCTNIISPRLSIITNISLDHTQFLGDTLGQIAREKAGIIKPHTPCIIGQSLAETRPVFESVAQSEQAELFFAEEFPDFAAQQQADGVWHYTTRQFGEFDGALRGTCQQWNARTVVTALQHFPERYRQRLTPEIVCRGFAEVTSLTGLMGRWQVLQQQPLVVCDTGHNLDAWQHLAPQLQALDATQLHIVLGASGDKDVRHILELMPRDARYYFTQASVARALPVATLCQLADEIRLRGASYDTVDAAIEAAHAAATPSDAIFIGGSSFVVADCLASSQRYRI